MKLGEVSELMVKVDCHYTEMMTGIISRGLIRKQ